MVYRLCAASMNLRPPTFVFRSHFFNGVDFGKEAASKARSRLWVIGGIHTQIARITTDVGSVGMTLVEEENQCSVTDRTNRAPHRLQNRINCRLGHRITPSVIFPKAVSRIGLERIWRGRTEVGSESQYRLRRLRCRRCSRYLRTAVLHGLRTARYVAQILSRYGAFQQLNQCRFLSSLYFPQLFEYL